MVVKMNEYQQNRFVSKVIREMFHTVADKKIAIFGFAFKANTGDTRESPAIQVAKKLLEEQAVISITDPRALENARIDLREHENVIFESDPYAAARGADALAILTEWDLFRELDYREIYQSMKKPAFIFDGRNILDHRELHEMGFNVYPLGQPALTHFT